MTRALDDDEKGTHIVRTLGGEQALTIISESGLYNAIFRSRRDEARRFRRWVTSEVLPTIRRHGSYGQLSLVDETTPLDPAALSAMNGLVRTAMKLGGPRAGKLVWQSLSHRLGLPSLTQSMLRTALTDAERVLQIIEEGGPAGFTATELSRKTQWLGRIQRDAALESLIASGQIMMDRTTTVGRPKAIYRRCVLAD